MPVSATAPAIAAAVSFAASYLTWSRWPTTSAEKSSRPGRFLNRRSINATSSRQSMPSILNVDSACSSQTVQVVVISGLGARGLSRRALLDVLESLLKQAHDVLVVERVVHEPAVAARTNQTHPAQEPQLV